MRRQYFYRVASTMGEDVKSLQQMRIKSSHVPLEDSPEQVVALSDRGWQLVDARVTNTAPVFNNFATGIFMQHDVQTIEVSSDYRTVVSPVPKSCFEGKCFVVNCSKLRGWVRTNAKTSSPDLLTFQTRKFWNVELHRAGNFSKPQIKRDRKFEVFLLFLLELVRPDFVCFLLLPLLRSPADLSDLQHCWILSVGFVSSFDVCEHYKGGRRVRIALRYPPRIWTSPVVGILRGFFLAFKLVHPLHTRLMPPSEQTSRVNIGMSVVFIVWNLKFRA